MYGFDERGREVLTYFPGTVGHPPLAPHLRGQDTLVALARLLRGFHDHTIGFVEEFRTGWRYPVREPAEVPLAPANDGGFGSPAEQLLRAQRLLDSYGPVSPATPPVLDQVLARVENMLHLVRHHPAFVRQRAHRHDEGYQRHLHYLREHARLWRTLRLTFDR